MSQKDLAERLGVTDKAVSRWESGAGYPEIETVARIASFFGVTTDYLLLDDGPMFATPPEGSKSPKPPHHARRVTGTVLFSVGVGLCIIASLIFIGILLYHAVPCIMAAMNPADAQRGAQFLGPNGSYFATTFTNSEVNSKVAEFAAAQGKVGLSVEDADFIQWKNALLGLYDLHGNLWVYKMAPYFDPMNYFWFLPIGLTIIAFIPCFIFQMKCINGLKKEQAPQEPAL